MPNAQQSLLLFDNVVYLRLKDSLLDDTPYLVVDQIEVGAVRRPQVWLSERARKSYSAA